MRAPDIMSLLTRAGEIAEQFGDTSDAATGAILAVLAYEETLRVKHGRGQPAAYTWRSFRTNGVIPAVEQIVTRSAGSQGLQALLEMGLEEFAFEAVVDRHPESFSAEAVRASRARLHDIQARQRNQPRYWWVNHKQTHEDEISEGYIWSPKENRNGAKNQTYLNLTLVKPGDIVISYASGLVKAIGVAQGEYQEAQIPEKHWEAVENWRPEGWMVPIAWESLSSSLRPKDFMDVIAPRLPTKNSPLQQNGNGNQSCYLASISIELGELILELAGHKVTSKVRPDLVDASLVEELKTISDAEIPETEKELLAKARVGQGVFKTRVIQIEGRCRVTGVDNPTLLIASHIKPWSESDNRERLDGNNGLLLAPHVDKLFDRGWISFTDNGDLLVTYGADEVLQAWGIDPESNVGAFSEKQAKYLEYHREHVFIGHPTDYL